MLKVKLGLQSLSVLEKIALANTIVTSMTGKAAFPTPAPALADVTEAALLLNAANTDRDTKQHVAEEATTFLGTREGELDATLTRLAGYVEDKANAPGVTPEAGKAMIQSASMDVQADSGHRHGPLSAPEGLSATIGDAPGEVDLHWHSESKSRGTVVRHTTDPTAPQPVWTMTLPVTRSKTTVPGLVSGTMYWFQAMFIGAGGGENNSPWSAMTNCRAA